MGTAIVENTDYLMFTGSTATGQLLAEQAGRRLIGFSAELGGKNPMIVAAGADLREVADAAVRACYSNSGQLCISIERSTSSSRSPTSSPSSSVSASGT